MALKIKTFPEQCISSGNCVLVAPKLFGQDEKGVVVVRIPEPDPADYAAAREAAASCPVIAIVTEED
jgi:ferredoxin